jgi:hypothetical protein
MIMTWRSISDHGRPARTRALPSCRGRAVTRVRRHLSVPFWQAARTPVKGYEPLHGYKIRFETTWLERP